MSDKASEVGSAVPTSSPGPSTRDTEALETHIMPVSIARNKHWRYISCYHGPWLTLPSGVLENLANSNWSVQRPRPVDPALFFDLVKIRKLVDDATDLSVRAESGIASSALSTSLNAANNVYGSGGAALGLGMAGAGSNAQLSPERKYRMREQATQKLSKAYHFDEIASCVATMQSATSLEKVAEQVNNRNREHLDSKYVHYFHEKIRFSDLMDPETLLPLDDTIRERPLSAEPLRTRAVAKMTMHKYSEAIADLTRALQLCKYQQSLHRPRPPTTQSTSEIKLEEEGHPSSLETQLLFHRARAYLSLACSHIEDTLAPMGPNTLPVSQSRTKDGDNFQQLPAENTTTAIVTESQQLEAGKIVKENAKRALRDYTAFLSHFDYSPGLHLNHMETFTHKVNEAAVGYKLPRPQNYKKEPQMANSTVDAQPPVILPVSSLFSTTPPTGLPLYPESIPSVDGTLRSNSKTTSDVSVIHKAAQQLLNASALPEALTFHPLLTEALHCLLLCHILNQTSTRELQRHAHMVARLVRNCDGYPIFQPSRTPSSRLDWIDILGHVGEMFALGATWDVLCNPTLYKMEGGPAIDGDESWVKKETEHEKMERVRHQAFLDTLEDDRVSCNKSFHQAVAGRQRRQEEEERRCKGIVGEYADGGSKKTEQDESVDVTSVRARNIIRWIREAPMIPGTGAKKKRKGRRSRTTATDSVGGSTTDMKQTNGMTSEMPNEDVD